MDTAHHPSYHRHDARQRRLPGDASGTLEVRQATLLALKELHKRGVTHNDLEPRDIIVDAVSRALPRVKLIDLGKAKLCATAGELRPR